MRGQTFMSFCPQKILFTHAKEDATMSM